MFKDFLSPSLNNDCDIFCSHLTALQSTRKSNRIIISVLQMMPPYTITACNAQSLMSLSLSLSYDACTNTYAYLETEAMPLF